MWSAFNFALASLEKAAHHQPAVSSHTEPYAVTSHKNCEADVTLISLKGLQETSAVCILLFIKPCLSIWHFALQALLKMC